MSLELMLSSVPDDPDAEVNPERLGRFAAVVLRVLRKFHADDECLQIEEGQLLVDLPGGTAEVRSNFAIFPIDQLDPLTMEVVFAIAKSGDLAVFAEGLEVPAIVLNAAQRQRLEESEGTGKECPICRSARQLGELLKDWHQWYVDIRTQALAAFETKDSPSPAAAPPGEATQEDTPRAVRLARPIDEDVFLIRFDTSGNKVPKSSNVLDELKDLCQRHFDECGDPQALLGGKVVGGRGTWPPLWIAVERDGYAASIYPFQAEFTMHRVVPVEFMWQVARVGDFTIVTNRGLVCSDPRQFARGLIVTDPGQLARLPKSWLKVSDVRTANSPEELGKLLWENDFNIPDFFHEQPAGTYPTSHLVIYFEALGKETDGKHQNIVFKHRPKHPLPEDEGGPRGSEFWELTTPAGKRFFAYRCAGLDWLDVFREQGREQGREVGQIVNYETFVQDDGQSFPISECQLIKTR